MPKEAIQPTEEQLPLIPENLDASETDSEETPDIIIEEEATDEKGKEKYFEAVGRRKRSVARVRLYTRKAGDSVKENLAIITVNGKDYTDYFKDIDLQANVEAPLRKLKSLNRFKALALVNGGGISGQADALRHGLARTLEKFDANFRKKLKKSGYLSRDARKKERRKYGLKKARKAGQWSKR
ncbi:MAG: 30S ribosomal protein S9 [Candidatus Yanofskybacteria bacterium]|nr:30S ribosomal protein S9 [Candidatus Yanofskybacteria bacterium]